MSTSPPTQFAGITSLDCPPSLGYGVSMVNHKIEARAIADTIDRSQSVLLIAHKRPDGDTLGSVCAWLHFLRDRGKNVTMYCNDPAPLTLQHLPGSNALVTDPSIFQHHYDCIIVNDSGDLEYAGVDEYMKARDNSRTTVINIDHHGTNPGYGHINLVIEKASSTTEILSRLFLHWGIPISKPMAENLLYGLVSDTDSMTNPATTYQSLHIASELISAGADLYDTVHRTLYNKSMPQLRLWGTALARLRYNQKLNMVSTYITHQDLTSTGATIDHSEGIANYLTLIPNLNAILLLTEREPGVIKGSLRTVKDTVDVSRLAQILGGGGHKKASGFKVLGALRVNDTEWTVA